MFRTALRNVLAHKARLLMTVLAVMLGVAFVSGTLVFTDTISSLPEAAPPRASTRSTSPSPPTSRTTSGDTIGKDPDLTQALLDKSAEAARAPRPPPASSAASPPSPTRTAS